MTDVRQCLIERLAGIAQKAHWTGQLLSRELLSTSDVEKILDSLELRITSARSCLQEIKQGGAS